MADLSKTVEILFSAKDKVSPSIQSIETGFRSMGEQVNAINGPLAEAGRAVLKLGTALAGLTAGSLGAAVKTAGDFGSGFKEITTLFSDTGAPVEKFKTEVLDYSTTSVKSMEDINKALYNAVSAGVKYGESVDFVRQAEKLAVAGKADLSDTTKVLISTLNAYGESTDKAARYSDILFTAVRIGQTTLPELNQSLAQVTPIAAGAGIPFETLAAALAALTVQGMPTEQAVTALKGTISAIIGPSAQAATAAKDMGLEFSASALKTKGLEGVLRDVQMVTGGSVEKLDLLFGNVRGLSGVLSLATNGSAKFNEALEGMKNAAGATEEAYRKLADGMSNTNQRMINSMKAVLVVIGEEIMPAYKTFVNNLSSMFAGVRLGMDAGAFDELYQGFNDIGQRIDVAMKKVAENIPAALTGVDWGPIIDSLNGVGKALADLFEGMDDPDSIKDALQDLADTFASVVEVGHGMGEVFIPIISGIRELVSAFNDLDASTKQGIGNAAGLSMAYKAFGPVIGTLLFAIGSDVEGFEKLVNGAFQAIENGMNVLKTGFYAVAGTIVGAAYSIGSAIQLVSGQSLVSDEDMAKLRGWGEFLADKFLTSVDKTVQSSMKLADTINGTSTAADAGTKAAKGYSTELEKIPGKKETALSILGVDPAKASIGEIKTALDRLDPTKDITVSVKADGTEVEKVYGMLISRLPDQTVTIVPEKYGATVTDQASKKLDGIPKEKEVEIQAKLDEAAIREQSAVVQSAMEWTAKIDIAQAETNLKSLEALSTSINNSMNSSGDVMKGLSTTYSTAKSGSSAIYDQIQAESKRRDEVVTMQKNLTAAQIANINARTDLLKKGEAIIKVEAKGLQPQLEAFMFEILKSLQVRATEEGASFLLGISGGAAPAGGTAT